MTSHKHLTGPERAAARWEQKCQRVANELANHINRNANLRSEIRRLEDALAWIHRTGQPIEEIRVVIERTIPTRLKRTTETAEPSPPETTTASM